MFDGAGEIDRVGVDRHPHRLNRSGDVERRRNEEDQ
jgi:hypothetical protein